ncbi:hypothetical protein C0989_002813 [Termitomyces sp. Mn162]|nr:hypothetical protein C0989_002813 [Termitomyces sp. Mn162]
MGMFATRDLAPSDLILAERPLLVVPQRDLNVVFTKAGHAQPPPVEAMEALLKVCVDRMLPDNRTAFFELHNCHTKDDPGPILGIVRTNGISIRILTEPSKLGKDDPLDFSGIFQTMSRINHSCAPNVTRHFDTASFSLRLHAIRPIKAGEELLMSYVDMSLLKVKRQEKLRPYGFDCACKFCTNPNCDALLSRILQYSIEETEPLEKLLQDSLRHIKEIEDANLESLSAYFFWLSKAAAMLTRMNKWDNATEYLAMMQAWHSAKFGTPCL